MPIVINNSRRRFLQSSIGGAAAIGIGSAIPDCFADAAVFEGSGKDRILVVVQLTGGNDGLNTIIPYADENYRNARPELAISASDMIRHDADTGFHPSMTALYDRLQAGQLTVIRSAGYEQPNRSHFEAMDIWHTCRRKSEQRTDGWLGRFIESQKLSPGGDVPAIHLGRDQQPFALTSQSIPVPTLTSLKDFQLQGRGRESLQLLMKRTPASPSENELLSFVQSSTASAIQASDRVGEAAKGYRSSIAYPESDLAEKLRTIAQLIDAGLTTRVYYVQLDGFDTHAEQLLTHSILLRDWSNAVGAFVQDLDVHGHGERVCVLTFSEFGRRVKENASAGTDHGAAGPMFLCGGGLKAGMVGERPDLTNLLEGDLKHEHDFRRVYASVLQSWLGVNPDPILGDEFETLPLFV